MTENVRCRYTLRLTKYMAAKIQRLARAQGMSANAFIVQQLTAEAERLDRENKPKEVAGSASL